MKPLRLTLVALLGTVLVFAITACGGGGQDVPANAVAVVDGTEISRSELDELIERARKTYESQDQEFPKVGTPEFLNVQAQYVKYLVQVEQFEQEAEERGIEVTEKDVDKEVAEFVKTRFQGKQAELRKALEAQSFSMEQFRETIRTSVLSQKLFDAVTKDVEVTDAEVLQYYQANQASYGRPESRTVRHILVSEKDGDAVDFAASKTEADRLYRELRNGADFAALAKSESVDTVSAAKGGELTINRGETVPEFDKLAFELKKGVVSRPVKTTYGYHIIEALSPVRKATTTPLDKVRASIRATLLQQKKTDFMTQWVEDLDEEYSGRVSYAAGFEPPELPETSDTETEATE